MTVWIALLRGINVGGNKKIRMAELKTLLESLGLRSVQTLLQSGNVVFETDQTNQNQLVSQIEAGIEQTFGFHSDVILRTREQLRTVVESRPFSDAQLTEPAKIAVIFLRTAPDTEAFESVRKSYTGPEEFHLNVTELYVFYPEGMGRSKLGDALSDRKLRSTGTARNWNTVTKLIALANTF